MKNEGVVPYATESTSPGPATKSASQLSFAAAKCTRPLGLWIGCSGSPPLAPVVFAFVNVKSAAPPDTVLLNSDVAMRIESPVLPFGITLAGKVNVAFRFDATDGSPE